MLYIIIIIKLYYVDEVPSGMELMIRVTVINQGLLIRYIICSQSMLIPRHMYHKFTTNVPQSGL